MTSIYLGPFQYVEGEKGIYIYLYKNTVPDPDEYVCKRVFNGSITQPSLSFEPSATTTGSYLDLQIDDYWFDAYFNQAHSGQMLSVGAATYIQQMNVNGKSTATAMPAQVKVGGFDYPADGFTVAYDSTAGKNYGYWIIRNGAGGFNFAKFEFNNDVFGDTQVAYTDIANVAAAEPIAPTQSWLPASSGTSDRLLTFGVPSKNGEKVAYTIERSYLYVIEGDDVWLQQTYVLVIDINTMTTSVESQGDTFADPVSRDSAYGLDYVKTSADGDTPITGTLTYVTHEAGGGSGSVSYPIAAAFDDSNALIIATVESTITASGVNHSGTIDYETQVGSVTESFSGSSTHKLKINGTLVDEWSASGSYSQTDLACGSGAQRVLEEDVDSTLLMHKLINLKNKEFVREEFKYTRDWSNTIIPTQSTQSDDITISHKIDHVKNGTTTNIVDQSINSVLTDTIEISTNNITCVSAALMATNYSVHWNNIHNKIGRRYAQHRYEYGYIFVFGAVWPFDSESNGVFFDLPVGASYDTLPTSNTGRQHARLNICSLINSTNDTSLTIGFNKYATPAVTGRDATLTTTNGDTTRDYTGNPGGASIYINGVLQQDANWSDYTWDFRFHQVSIR